jgi:hypothetical protein
VLEPGTDFTLEADDSLGPTRSTLEFVTVPFDETPEGYGRLRAAAVDMLQIVDRIDGREAPGPSTSGTRRPPYPISVESFATDFVHSDVHALRGSAEISGKDVLLSGGEYGFPVQMQSTAGLPLADLPAMLERLGHDVPGETPAQETSRRRDRATMHPPGEPPPAALLIMGQAPSIAREMVGAMRGHPDFTEALSEDTQALSGFLAGIVMVAAFLRQQHPPTQRPALLVKERLPLMPRNNFGQMYAALPEGQRTVLARHPGALTELLLPVLGSGSSRVRRSTPLIPPGNPYSAPERALATLTIDEWLRGVVNGHDWFSQAGMERRLAGDERFMPDAKRTAVEAMESIGTYPAGERRDDTGDELFAFENRYLNPIAEGLPTMKEALDTAFAIFEMFMKIRRRKA